MSQSISDRALEVNSTIKRLNCGRLDIGNLIVLALAKSPTKFVGLKELSLHLARRHEFGKENVCWLSNHLVVDIFGILRNAELFVKPRSQSSKMFHLELPSGSLSHASLYAIATLTRFA
jgi:hypothetical protein